jgi:hypothetical protein
MDTKTFWNLAIGAWSDLRTWGDAVEDARRKGWTLDECLMVLNLTHPLTFIIVLPWVVLFFGWLFF